MKQETAKYKAAIFDLDGTLIDSTWVWNEIYKKFSETFSVKNGFNLEKIMHLPPTECCTQLKMLYNLNETVDELKQMFYSLALDFYSNDVKLKPGVSELLKLLNKNEILICLATSNHVKISELILKKYDIFDYFCNFNYSEELKINKTTAAIYLQCAKDINIPPEKCAVFEDIADPVDDIKLNEMGFFGINDDFQNEVVKKVLKQESECFIENYFDFIKNDFNKYFLNKI